MCVGGVVLINNCLLITMCEDFDIWCLKDFSKRN